MTPLRRSIGAALLAAGGLASVSGAAAQEEVPFITTPDRVTLVMLEMAGVGPRDHVIDLGSGDGRIVITAARRFGARGHGVEIVPDLVDRSRRHARQAGVEDRATFAVQDLFQTDLSAATVITMYLLPDVNLQLRPRLLALAPGTRLVSHDWDMGDWPPDRTLTLAVPEKTIGRDKVSRVHLWWVPAPVDGAWCGPGGQRLELRQQYQRVDARLHIGPARTDTLSGRLRGADLHLAGVDGTWQLRWQAPGVLTGPVIAAPPEAGTAAGAAALSWRPCPPG